MDVKCEYCNSSFTVMGKVPVRLSRTLKQLCFVCEFCSAGFTGAPFEGTYQDYLKSPQWRALRRAAIERAGKKCQICNSDLLLQVHHRNYPSNLGWEEPMDLIVLCRRCHGLFHNVRA